MNISCENILAIHRNLWCTHFFQIGLPIYVLFLDDRNCYITYWSAIIRKSLVYRWSNGTNQVMGYIRQHVNCQFLKLMCWRQETWTSLGIWATLWRTSPNWTSCGLFPLNSGQIIVPTKSGLTASNLEFVSKHRLTNMNVKKLWMLQIHIFSFSSASVVSTKQIYMNCYLLFFCLLKTRNMLHHDCNMFHKALNTAQPVKAAPAPSQPELQMKNSIWSISGCRTYIWKNVNMPCPDWIPWLSWVVITVIVKINCKHVDAHSP